MRTYALYIEDDRYSVPTLLFVTAKDDSAVRRIAREKLLEPITVEWRCGKTSAWYAASCLLTASTIVLS